MLKAFTPISDKALELIIKINKTMKKIILLFLLLTFNSAKLFSQDDDMKKWQEYMTPGKEHQMLANLDGDWTYTSTMWMTPGAEPQTYEGNATFEMVLGGRYSLSKHSGKVMGMDFNGINYIGYDNAKKVWLNMWIDNLGTGMMFAEGIYDETTKTITFSGKFFDPMTKKDSDFRETIKFIDDRQFVLEMFNMFDGKEFKSTEIKSMRK